MGGYFVGIRTRINASMEVLTLNEPFPHHDPEEQAEFLRHRLFDRLAACRGKDAISAEDLRLLLGLLDATDRPSRRASVIAEIGVAERLLALGAHLRVEVPNPEGRSADLEVLMGDTRFFLHLKRLPDPPQINAPDSDPENTKNLDIFNPLEELKRPYRVGLRYSQKLTTEQLEAIRDQLHDFLLSSRMGDRRIIRDEHEHELAAAAVIAPSDSGHIELAYGAIDRASAEQERAHRLLRRAYRQFVPGAENVILLIGGGPHAGETMELALLGTHVERWDRLPRRNQRVAHGRAGDGLWSERHYERSRIAAWLEDPFADGRSWTREGEEITPQVMNALSTLLDGKE